MSERLGRVVAIVRADVLIRLRRPSTLVVFLLLSALAYLWVPDPATGRTLIQVNGQRALYNSAAIGMATAMIGTILIGLAGYYVVSNAVRRDVLSRCGYVIGATTMRSSEYVFGKFAGNVAFLTLFMTGFMLCSMAMILVRGEAPLEIGVFLTQYALLVPPVISFVAAMAILFECTPLLRTKFGDVLYFFVWAGGIGVVAAVVDKPNAPLWPRFFDTTGLAFVISQVNQTLHTTSMSIGQSPFDPKKGTLVFNGLRFEGAWAMARIGSAIWPLALLVPATLFFHRFDPARVRAVPNEGARRSWSGRANLLAKPFARLVVGVGQRVLSLFGGASLMRSIATDALATLAAFPLAAIAAGGLAIAALATPAAEVFTGVLPIAFALTALVISDVASREKRSGTMALVFAAPSLRPRFVVWKFGSALTTAAVLLAIPLLRAISLRPHAAPALLGGLLFTTAAATALGIVSANAKTFIVAFLSFWYVSMSGKGAYPAMDFAGFFGTITPRLVATYAVISVVLLVGAEAFHRHDLRRNW